ncbi:hypothetical protein MHU86_11805 [Fragilaria crotonensis]|nr:hypothetical protein MHU86_11805 [Fragilaria crotonensis]
MVFSQNTGASLSIWTSHHSWDRSKIAPPKARALRSEDQPSVDRYLESFKQYADDHRLWDRVADLTTVASTLTPEQCKESFDAIDRDVTRGMLHAEKQARRPSGKYAWSPKLREAGLTARYWHLREKLKAMYVSGLLWQVYLLEPSPSTSLSMMTSVRTW